MHMQFDESKICSTLSKTSKADNGKYVVDCNDIVYNFDKITEEIANIYRSKRPLKSCDALHIKDDTHIYLIEFKNVRKSRVPKKELQKKAYDSIWTLEFSFFPHLPLSELKKRVRLIVVYNDDEIVEKEQESENFTLLKNKLKHFSGTQQAILFGLEIYENVLYKEIITVEKDFFMHQIYEKIFPTAQRI